MHLSEGAALGFLAREGKGAAVVADPLHLANIHRLEALEGQGV